MVEDDSITVLILQDMLTELLGSGTVFADASTAPQALEMVRQAPDLITLDMHLAENTSGTAFVMLYDGMVKRGELPAIPIVVISSDPSELEALRVTCATIRTVLKKPVNIDNLRAAVSSLFGDNT